MSDDLFWIVVLLIVFLVLGFAYFLSSSSSDSERKPNIERRVIQLTTTSGELVTLNCPVMVKIRSGHGRECYIVDTEGD